MRENRLYGSEGGVARQRHPYPYPNPKRKIAYGKFIAFFF